MGHGSWVMSHGSWVMCVCVWCVCVSLVISHADTYGFDHINRNAPVLIRTPKLTRFEPAQYWGGGPPGNSVVLNPSFWLLFSIVLFGVLLLVFLLWDSAMMSLIVIMFACLTMVQKFR